MEYPPLPRSVVLWYFHCTFTCVSRLMPDIQLRHTSTSSLSPLYASPTKFQVEPQCFSSISASETYTRPRTPYTLCQPIEEKHSEWNHPPKQKETLDNVSRFGKATTEEQDRRKADTEVKSFPEPLRFSMYCRRGKYWVKRYSNMWTNRHELDIE